MYIWPLTAKTFQTIDEFMIYNPHNICLLKSLWQIWWDMLDIFHSPAGPGRIQLSYFPHIQWLKNTD